MIPSSFHRRLTLMVAAALTLTVIVVCALQLGLNYAGMRRISPAGIKSRAAVLGLSLEAPLRFDDRDEARAALEALRGDGRTRAAWVYRADGTLFAAYGLQAPSVEPLGPDHVFRGDWITVRSPIAHQGERLGTIVLTFDLSQTYAEYRRTALISALIGGLVLLVALRVTSVLAGRLTRPVIELSDLAGRVSQTGDYGLRATPAPVYELQRLADGFNVMMERVEAQAQELAAARDTLERRVAERTAESERRARELRALAAELTVAEERVRKRLAQVLHDDLQQYIVAARMHLEAVLHPPYDLNVNNLRKAVGLMQEALTMSRSLTAELAPPILYDAGFAEALHWLARSKADKYGLKVQLDLDAEDWALDEPIKVFLFRALRELLFNVVKHAGVQEATVRVRESGDEIHVSVEDGGVGFDPAKTPGFGLLSIRERLEYFGGRLEIRSGGAGEGTAIALHAPLRASAEVAAVTERRTASKDPVPQAPTPISMRRVRVLLVDDHKILREGVASMLNARHEIRVVGEAATGSDAIELARRLQPDVIVMDISMPGMSGIEATRRITAENPRVRIVGLSMHEERDLAEHMFRAGAAAYLPKGGPAERLIRTILSVVA